MQFSQDILTQINDFIKVYSHQATVDQCRMIFVPSVRQLSNPLRSSISFMGLLTYRLLYQKSGLSSILLIPLVLELIFRFSAEKSSAKVFLLSLLAAGMVFFALEMLTRVEEDPWGLDKVWQGYTSVIQKAEKLRGVKVKTL